MALDKPTLVSSLTAAFADISAGKTPAQAAQQVADAIDVYVKTGQVQINQAGLTTGPLLDSVAAPCTTAAPITGTIL